MYSLVLLGLIAGIFIFESILIYKQKRELLGLIKFKIFSFDWENIANGINYKINYRNRFTSDQELICLVDKVMAEKLSEKEIKKEMVT